MKDVIIQFLTKWWIYIFYIFMGIVGKFSWDISQNKKITFLGAVASVGMSGFIGYIASVWCQERAMETQAAYLVPLATLMSDRILTYIVLRIKWTEIRDAIINVNKP